MLVLGIETSCDETSVALLRFEAGVPRLRANLIASQIEAHQMFGGVVPEIASRQHLSALGPLLATLRRDCDLDWRELSLIGVTHGPGLAGALLVGVAGAKALSFAHQIPCVPVNHVEGHIASNFLARPDLKLPMLCLVVSGGHTDLILMRDWGDYQRLGRTRDDAIGEAFDKVARVLELPQPGGPNLEIAATRGDDVAFEFRVSDLEPSLDFSYSGLKTAASQARAKSTLKGENRVEDIAAGFQRAAVKQIRRNVERALTQFSVATLGLCGGVAANSHLRAEMLEAAAQANVDCVVPDKILCTDNAAMIACAAFQRWNRREPEAQTWSIDSLDFDTHSMLPIA